MDTSDLFINTFDVSFLVKFNIHIPQMKIYALGY